MTSLRFPSLVEPFLVEVVGQEVGDLEIVEVREREMRVAEHADLGKAQDRRIATMAIDGIHEQRRHCDGPVMDVEPRIRTGLRRDVVPLDDLDRDPRQFLEVVWRYGFAG